MSRQDYREDRELQGALEDFPILTRVRAHVMGMFSEILQSSTKLPESGCVTGDKRSLGPVAPEPRPKQKGSNMSMQPITNSTRAAGLFRNRRRRHELQVALEDAERRRDMIDVRRLLLEIRDLDVQRVGLAKGFGR